jgi:hypothetical protein
MKNIFLILLILMFTSGKAISQNPIGEEKKLIGKVNLAGDASYILQLHVENEEYVYSIIDVKNNGSELSSFKLIFNDQSTFDLNFKKAINSISAFSDDFKKKGLSESQMYYYALNVIRPALPQGENGPLAMDLKFGDQATVRKISYGKNNFVRRRDVRNFLRENQIDSIPEAKNSQIWVNPELSVKKITASVAKDRFQKELFLFFTENEVDQILGNEQDGPSSTQKTDSIIFENFYFELINGIEKARKSRLTRPNKTKASLGLLQDYIRNSKYLSEKKLKSQIDRNSKEKIGLETDLSLRRAQLLSELSSLNSLDQKIQSKSVQLDSLVNEIGVLYEQVISDMRILDFEIQEYTTNESIQNLRNYAEELNQSIEDIYNQFPDSLQKISSKPVTVSLNFQAEESEDESPENRFGIPSFERGFRISLRDVSTLRRSNQQVNSLDQDRVNFRVAREEKNSVVERIKRDTTELSAKIDNIKMFDKKIEEYYIKQLFNSGTYEVKISSVQMEFNAGFIENIVVMTEPTFPFSDAITTHSLPKGLPTVIKFTNQYPMGFSAKRDLNILKYEKLTAIVDEKTEFSLDFKDVVTNVEELLVLDRTDYSPMDGSIKINPNTTTEKELYKNKSTEILQAKVFSDLAGINGEKPNGLIQFEVDKEIPLVTRRYGKSDIIAPFRWFIPRKNNVGFFNFIRPEFVLSKIESNLKELELNRVADSLVVSTLDIRQFEKVSVGADMNLTFMDMPFAKSTIYINAGFRFGRTDLKLADNDTLVNNTKGFTNTFQFNPEIGYRINGDERYGLDFNYSPNLIISDERGFSQIADIFEAKETDKTILSVENHLHRITLTAYFNFNPGTKGRFFFRFRSFHQWDKWSNNFSQYQLGYSTFITR